MAKKPKEKAQEPPAGTEDGVEEKPRGSKKMLLAAAGMCILSLGGGFFLARMAYMQDAEAYEPEYKAEEDGEAKEGDDYAEKDGKDGKDKDKGKDKAKLRDDITDPLAKDGHDAEKAMALQDKDAGKDGKDGKAEAVADTGLLDFGEILTNIQGFDATGAPTTSFLKVHLMVAYRPDAGAGQIMVDRQPFMRDLFNGYLRGISEADVRGMAGILYIKAELLKRARAAVGSDLPQEILIRDLIVQ